jgi:tetratricopeptide (TPR) repeat protein
MKRQNLTALTLLLVLSACFAVIRHLQERIDMQRAELREERDELLLRSGKLIKGLSLEYAPLLADIYWTRAVQYYGNKRARHDSNAESLWPLLDVTTTLDPNLIVAYRFGATFLSEASPRGAGRPDLAVQLIDRGIKANPDNWRLYQDLGFVYYFDLKDYRKASEAFLEGSKNPQALIWMKIMAARIAAEGESLETSVFLWQEILQSTKDPSIKKNALTHLQLLRVELDCKQIDALGDEFEKRHGRRPRRLNELLQEGLVLQTPVDPLKYPYTLDENGHAQLNLNSPLLEEQLTHATKK